MNHINNCIDGISKSKIWQWKPSSAYKWSGILTSDTTAPSEDSLSKDLPVPYNISSRLPTYEEATANTSIPSSYDQLYGDRSHEDFGQIPSPNFQPLNASSFPDSNFGLVIRH